MGVPINGNTQMVGKSETQIDDSRVQCPHLRKLHLISQVIVSGDHVQTYPTVLSKRNDHCFTPVQPAEASDSQHCDEGPKMTSKALDFASWAPVDCVQYMRKYAKICEKHVQKFTFTQNSKKTFPVQVEAQWPISPWIFTYPADRAEIQRGNGKCPWCTGLLLGRPKYLWRDHW